MTILTNTEFRLFAEQLELFARGLRPRERAFLTSILLRAITGDPHDLLTFGPDQDSGIATGLAFALWRSGQLSDDLISLNPQPLPERNTITPVERRDL